MTVKREDNDEVNSHQFPRSRNIPEEPNFRRFALRKSRISHDVNNEKLFQVV